MTAPDCFNPAIVIILIVLVFSFVFVAGCEQVQGDLAGLQNGLCDPSHPIRPPICPTIPTPLPTLQISNTSK